MLRFTSAIRQSFFYILYDLFNEFVKRLLRLWFNRQSVYVILVSLLTVV